MYVIDFFFFQGSEIFTVYAKDGDQGNPNPIHYSILNGKNNTLTPYFQFEVTWLFLIQYHY